MPTTGCPDGKDTCLEDPGLDPVEDIMDSSYDDCTYAFTPGQAARMDAVATAFRAEHLALLLLHCPTPVALPLGREAGRRASGVGRTCRQQGRGRAPVPCGGTALLHGTEEDTRMDDRTGTSTAAKVVLSALGFLVAVLLARAVLGDLGVQVVLLGTMVVVSALAWCQLTRRPLLRLSLLACPADDRSAPVREDAWRSERWIAEAVERGLRALDEWRLEQREA